MTACTTPYKTMKPLVTLALACALFSGVYTLDCYQCIQEDISQCQAKPCLPDQTECRVAYIEAFPSQEGGAATVERSCATPAECNIFVNFGVTRGGVNCCGAARCNNASVLPQSYPNGKKCFTCVDMNCTETLQLECKGSEDHCITSTASNDGPAWTMKGCASETGCSEIKKQPGLASADHKCCQGDMCNNALRIGQSVLVVLLVPLAFFILFN